MADRPNHIPGYPMMPNNFPMSMGQQQQQFAQQQHLQSQRPQGGQPIAGVNNPEHQQMWQKIQQQHQSRGGGEGVVQQRMDQMADFLRSQDFAQQVQGQQQHPQQGQQQYPGVGAGNHNNPNLLPQQLAMQPVQRPHLQQQFASGQLPQAAQLLRGANPAMLPNGLPNGLTRQLGLMGNARNQQPQNVPNPVRIQPPMQPLNGQQGQLPFQQNMFPPTLPEGIRSSPQLPPQVPPTATPAVNPQNFAHMQLQMQQALQQFMKANDGSERRLTTPEILLKAKTLKQDIEVKEQHLQQMSANQGESSPAYRQLASDIARRRALLLRLQALFSRSAAGMQQGGPQQPPRPNDGSGPGPNSSASGSQQVAPMQQPPGWQQSMANMNYGNQPPQSSNQMPPQAPSPNIQPNVSQFQGMPAPGQVPQGLPSGPTQQQMLQAMMNQRQNQSPHPSQMPAGPSGLQQQQLQQSLQMAQAGRMNSTPTVPPMVDSKRFHDNLKMWLQKSGTPVDARLLTVDNRSIDLHQLHREVMLLGGGQAVSHRDLWPVVAAKLGWTTFPSNGNEPARSAPQAAAHVNNVYNMYLSGFEAYYVQAFMRSRNAEDHQNAPAGPPRPPSTPQAPNGMNPSFHSQQRLLQYAELSADEIRSRGESEHVVQQVEANRGVLQRQVLQQQALRSMNAQGMQSTAPNAMQQLMQSNGSQPFGTPQPPQMAPQGPPQALMNQITGQQGGLQGMHNPNGAVGMPRPVSQLGGVQGQGQGSSSDPGQRQVYSRPSAEQLFASQRYIQAMKADFNANRTLQQLQPKHLPDHERNEFNKMLEMLWRGAEQIDQWMSLYHAVFQDQLHTQRLIQIIITTNHQRQLLSSGQPNYVLDLGTVKRLLGMVQAAWEKFVSAVRTFPDARGNGMPGGPLGPPGPGPLPPSGPPQPPQQTIQQSAPQHPLTPHPQSQQPPLVRPPTAQELSRPQTSPTRQPSQLAAGPSGQPGQPGPPVPVVTKHRSQGSVSGNIAPETFPSPSATVTTPVPSASTPSHAQGSPQTPKSPKTRAPPKGKGAAAAKRRISKAVPPVAEATSPADSSTKRQREEEPPAPTAAAPVTDPAPSPKRIKSEWSTDPKDAYVKDKEAENIQTDEQAAAFYEQMTELVRLANDGPEGTSSLPPVISETLEMIVKSMGTGYDFSDNNIASSSSLTSDTINQGLKSPNLKAQNEEFNQFFDFASFLHDDDAGSKAETPDLVPTSSTNPSPESGSDAEPGTGSSSIDTARIVDSKSHPSTEPAVDPLRLGIWGEVDGGESDYYSNIDGWKWEGQMPSLESPWAIST